MDEAVFRWINGWPDSLTPFFWFLSEATKQDWVRGFLAAMIVGMLIAGPKTRRAAIYALLAWALANGFTEALKTGIAFERPCVALADVNLRVGKLTTYGTASSHAANMAAVAFAFTAGLGNWGWIWIPIAFLVGLSRIYVGVHFPSQVLLGWICGAFAGLVVVQMHRSWVDLRNRNQEAVPESLE
ncbi:MAG TPA: phosphatase PAP2 family protein [Fimbriimonadaceae bacterium]|nr:phosphatase PAP2 family protein [Fimbriimonadaceae bacterium]